MRTPSVQLNHITLHIPMQVILCTLDPHCPLLSAFVAAPELAANACCWKGETAPEASAGTRGHRRRLSGHSIINPTDNFCISTAGYLPFLNARLDHWILAHGIQQLIDRITPTRRPHRSAPSLCWKSSTKGYFATAVADCDTDSAALHPGRWPKAILNESVTISSSRVS